MSHAQAVIAATLLLAACTPKTVVRYLPPSCPAVPECTRAQAYLQRDAELAQCKIARDTLQQCLTTTPKP